MTNKRTTTLSIAWLAALPLLATAAAADPTVVLTKADLNWKDMGNGITAAVVSGDMEKGQSRFFLKYPVGLVTPNHHHDANHHVTMVSGTITLTVDGKAYKLEPGAYFTLTNKAPHIARVEGNEPAVFFIQSDGPWNVVMEQ